MTVSTKVDKGYRKYSTSNDKTPVQAATNLVFAHQASEGDTTIPYDSLVAPASWTASGRVNPSASKILQSGLWTLRDNVTVTSSAKGLINKSQYRVTNNYIEFLTFTALAGEEFEVYVGDVLKEGAVIADYDPVNSSGILLAGQTDFNIGRSVSLKTPPLVFRDGIQMFQHTNNSDIVLDGNFYIIPATADEGSIVRFKDAPGANANIYVYQTLVSSPELSALQQLESLAGQVDVMIPSLAAVAGVDPSTFQSGPNSVDLLNFGNQVTQNVADILTKQNIVVAEEYAALGYQTTSYGTVFENTINQTGTVSFGSGFWEFTALRRVRVDGFHTVKRGSIGASCSVAWQVDKGSGYVQRTYVENQAPHYSVADGVGGSIHTILDPGHKLRYVLGNASFSSGEISFTAMTLD